MPLSLEQAQALTAQECMGYIDQIRELDSNLYDREYLYEMLHTPSNSERLEILRSLIIRERHRLHPIWIPVQSEPFHIRVRGNANLIDQMAGYHWSGSTNSLRLYGANWEYPPTSFTPAIERPLGFPHAAPEVQPPLPGFRDEIPKRKPWETAFLDEEMREDVIDHVLPPHVNNQFYEGVPIENPVGFMEYSLKEIAAMIPPGTLGAHMKDDQVFNLVYRSKRENDPRKKILKGTEWFEVRGEKAVLWASPTLEAIRTLEDTGLEFDMTARVKRWYAGAIPETDSLIEVGPECPLFDYQKEAVSFLWGRERAMLSLSPGLGKTLTSAYSAGFLHKMYGTVKRILLVCPASLLYYWKGELEKWSEQLPCEPMPWVWHRETHKLPDEIPEGKQLWVISNPETVVKNLEAFEQGFDLMICDESIMYKHRESSRSQSMDSLARSIRRVWLLTGAPATRYLDDMWHQFHMLDNRGYASYWRFADRYCIVDEDVWGKTVVANRKGAEEKIKENFADIYFARNQDQVADIPDWLMEDIDVPMKPKQDAIYEKLKKDLKIQIASLPANHIIRIKDRLSMVLRSIQVASNPVLLGADNSSGKWAVLPELMELYPGPFIVWVNFIRTGEMLLDTLQDKFGTNSVRLANGSTSMEERNNIVNEFQKGRYEAVILNNTVGKFGFNLTEARTAFFVERTYDDSYFQCLHRNRRIGTVHSPIIVNMRSVTRSGKHTIDHVVHDALDYRNSMIKNITVGDLRKILE